MATLEAGGIVGSDGGMVQGGLKAFTFTKLPGRPVAQQKTVASTPMIHALFELLKVRGYELLKASGRDPDAYIFDKIVSLLAALGDVAQAKHFDDDSILQLLCYPWATVPTMVTLCRRPTFAEAMQWIQENEPNRGADVFALIADWPFAMARRWIPLLVHVMMNPPTAPPISVVNRESALLLEPGVVHHSPAAPYSSHDALIPPGNGNRVSIFSTVVKRPGGALPGSWMRQDLTTLHKESVGVLRYPLQQQFGILSAAYHLGCKRTAFWALRSGHRMPGDGQAEFWVCSKRDLEAMKAVTELPAGAATMPAATRGVAAGESLLDATERRFDACWFSEQRKPLPMLPRDYD